MRHVVLLGAGGQLATELSHLFDRSADRFAVTSYSHDQLDLLDADRLRDQLVALRPDVIINTAAYHLVDEIETQPERAFAVNATAVRQLALVSRELDAALVQLSTDYVFGGDTQRRTPYVETDRPDPVNAYGVSKLAGEYFVRSIAPRSFVIRSSGLYGVAGSRSKKGNFVELMLRLAREGRPINVVDDQRLTPTFTADLAATIVALLDSDAYGLYHVTNTGDCSWYEFARAIFAACGLEPECHPVATVSFGAQATRPAYSVLDNALLRRTGLTELRPWQAALRAYLVAKGHLAA